MSTIGSHSLLGLVVPRMSDQVQVWFLTAREPNRFERDNYPGGKPYLCLTRVLHGSALWILHFGSLPIEAKEEPVRWTRHSTGTQLPTESLSRPDTFYYRHSHVSGQEGRGTSLEGVMVPRES